MHLKGNGGNEDGLHWEVVIKINRLYNLSKWQYDLSSMYILIDSIVWN